MPALLVLAGVGFHGVVLFNKASTFPWDFSGHHFALATAYADALREGQLPLWDPFTYCGRPLLANPQTAVFYPPMFAAVVFGREGLLERMEWMAVLHIVMAGVLAYLLAVRLGYSEPAAATAALVFQQGGFLASEVQHLGAVFGAPWLVLSWLAILLQGRIRVLLLSLSWAMSFLSGFPAFTLMTCLATVVFAFFQRAEARIWRDFILAGAMALGMVCVQLGPTLVLIGQSVGKYRTDWMGLGGGLPPSVLLSLLIPGYGHLSDLSQLARGADLTMRYAVLGVSSVCLAAVAARFGAFRMLGVCLLCLVLMLGENTTIGKLAYFVLPEALQRTTYWYVYLAPFTLGVALLAGGGVRHLGRLAWLACLVAGLELTFVNANRPFNKTPETPLSWARSPVGSTDLASELRGLAGDLRIDTANDGLELMAGAPILRWRAANGYDPLALEGVIQARGDVAAIQRWGAYYQVERPDSPALDWMSVRVLTSRTRLQTARLQEAGELPGRWVYINPTAMPRYRARGCEIEIVSEMRNRVELRASCSQPSVLETSEAYYSRWKAEVDGSPVPLGVIHSGFRALPLRSGGHRIVMSYSTSLLSTCAGVTVLFWLIWAAHAFRAAWLRIPAALTRAAVPDPRAADSRSGYYPQ